MLYLEVTNTEYPPKIIYIKPDHYLIKQLTSPKYHIGTTLFDHSTVDLFQQFSYRQIKSHKFDSSRYYIPQVVIIDDDNIECDDNICSDISDFINQYESLKIEKINDTYFNCEYLTLPYLDSLMERFVLDETSSHISKGNGGCVPKDETSSHLSKGEWWMCPQDVSPIEGGYGGCSPNFYIFITALIYNQSKIGITNLLNWGRKWNIDFNQLSMCYPNDSNLPFNLLDYALEWQDIDLIRELVIEHDVQLPITAVNDFILGHRGYAWKKSGPGLKVLKALLKCPYPTAHDLLENSPFNYYKSCHDASLVELERLLSGMYDDGYYDSLSGDNDNSF